ncbi:PilX N-terminal domain-containing pilus assembly protein [Psychrobium sp. 1_MG-2023]|uniref:PilX N-terminal domain-containing pilus assembly protein n=1 Tax=Psychrobium sp. 1_MG-2023 TaxID=3062624 RepID=UPI000C348868|nr:PilX N-terminal domain-containing pilus assembly protein [Psychrobium sp. 1_MG-2023]MDP2561851.1 PilX N-terminal domain-containing pilus assembly protein [Psychrobium sp. 1_MG-2023]PKF55778.1 hypothetical protein CW748_11590 [Alteromonadales bacterium alter-6D02]
MTKHQSRNIKQQGAALVICLVLLLVITLISIAGLSDAADQEKMASNAQQYNQTFQAAEGAMSQALNIINGGNSAQLSAAMAAGFDTPIDKTATGLETSYMDVTISYTHKKVSSIPTGISLNADENSVVIGEVRFVLDSEAKMPQSGATTKLSQGISYE